MSSPLLPPQRLVRNTEVHQSAKRRVKSLKSLVGSLLYFAFCTLLVLLKKLTQDLPMLYLYGIVWRRNTRTRSHKPIERERQIEGYEFFAALGHQGGFSKQRLFSLRLSTGGIRLHACSPPLATWLANLFSDLNVPSRPCRSGSSCVHWQRKKRKKISRENVAAFS